MTRSSFDDAASPIRQSTSSMEESAEFVGNGQEEAGVLLRREHEALQRARQKLWRWCAGLCLMLCVATVIMVAQQSWAVFTRAEGRAGHSAPLPSLPVEKVTFEEDKRFASPSSRDSDEAWQSLMPDGDGFILLDRPAEFHLPQGKTSIKGPSTAQIYDTSLFHQLHCLKHIHEFLYTLKSSIVYPNATEIATPMLAPQTVWENVLAPQEPHVSHCFDYIRQGIMCAGDLTLEWPRMEEDGRRFAVDGWGVTHECRSWEGIMSWMEENGV